MGCFRVQQSDGDAKPKRSKRRRVLWWSFSFVFFKNSGRTSSSGSAASSGELSKIHDLRQFTLAELKAATKNFGGEKLGEGGFGSVYRGFIKFNKDERIDVAVKQLNVKGQQGQKEWLNEVTYLRMVEHPNLVKLLGYCLEHDERGPQCLLVYELMPNKSLDDHLFQARKSVIPWNKRLQIALGTARALAYLHEKMKPPIIYRDLKSANILLDNEFMPKLSDFGLARDGPVMGNTHVTTAYAGTPGYAAPEYVQTGHLNAKSDVWTFGMVLLELLTGKRALDMNRPRSERSLADWVKPYGSDSRKFRRILDPRLKPSVSLTEAGTVLSLAQRCIAKSPKHRPKMSEVVKLLEGLTSTETGPIEKPVGKQEPAAADDPDAGSRTQSIASMGDISETSRTDFSEFSLAEMTLGSITGDDSSKDVSAGISTGLDAGLSKESSSGNHTGESGEADRGLDADARSSSQEAKQDAGGDSKEYSAAGSDSKEDIAAGNNPNEDTVAGSDLKEDIAAGSDPKEDLARENAEEQDSSSRPKQQDLQDVDVDAERYDIRTTRDDEKESNEKRSSPE